MLGLTIAAIVTVAAGYLIVKRAYAPAVLLVAGVVLLAIAAFGDIGLGLGLKKSSGSIFFDIFLVVENVMSTTLAKLGLSIMCMAGFAKYMDRVHAGRALYDVVGGPLKYVKSPYVLAGMGLIVTQIVGLAIPSAAGLALMMMVTPLPGHDPRGRPEDDGCLHNRSKPILRPWTGLRELPSHRENREYRMGGLLLPLADAHLPVHAALDADLHVLCPALLG